MRDGQTSTNSVSMCQCRRVLLRGSAGSVPNFSALARSQRWVCQVRAQLNLTVT